MKGAFKKKGNGTKDTCSSDFVETTPLVRFTFSPYLELKKATIFKGLKILHGKKSESFSHSVMPNYA